MNPALQKTLSFLLLIVAGYFLQKKIAGKQDLKGVKVLILSVVLPATIFVALLKIEISAGLIFLPILALAFNLVLFYIAQTVLPFLGYEKDTNEWRTAAMLIPSLAPGLSCMPFALEYLGEDALANSALADIGNKVFVLIILYLVAMNWYYRACSDRTSSTPNRKGKLKNLGLSLLREPVNLVIVAAILMLSFDLNLSMLPDFLSGTAVRLAGLMTPVVLLFIGMAVRFEKKQTLMILRVLGFRAGIGLLFSGLALLILPPISAAMALLLVIFPQSAVSFWPFAHMSAIESLREEDEKKVFNIDLALNTLAYSLPFSTVIILGVLSFGETFASPWWVLSLGLVFLTIPALYSIRKAVTLMSRDPKKHRSSMKESVAANG
ncbi:AEC family transporter [Neolewinella persica]|uniref:AEC family transporter n=1 Tax=Neolewinella persica TaxID=70998 RepID=UPI00037B497D|nr:hypothetical protein [Neolewinella persica]